MKRPLLLAAVTSTAALGLAPTAAAKVTVLRASYVDFSFRLVDHPPLQSSENQPPSPGDVAIVGTRYTSQGRVVATDRTTCTVLEWPHLNCNVTVFLRAGRLVAAGHFNPMSRATQRLAITGGTGAYRTARGDIALRQTATGRGTAVFTIIT